MFPPESFVQAESGGGGNRTRDAFPPKPLTRAEIVAYIRKRDGDCCFYCEKLFDPKTVQLDHVTPRSRGGATSVDNLVLACPPCNYEKLTHAAWLFLLLRERGPVPRRLAPADDRMGSISWRITEEDWRRMREETVVIYA